MRKILYQDGFLERPIQLRHISTARRVLGSLFILGHADRRDMLHSVGFRVSFGTAVREFVENVESATATLDRVRKLITLRLPNIRIVTEDGRPARSPNSRA